MPFFNPAVVPPFNESSFRADLLSKFSLNKINDQQFLNDCIQAILHQKMLVSVTTLKNDNDYTLYTGNSTSLRGSGTNNNYYYYYFNNNINSTSNNCDCGSSNCGGCFPNCSNNITCPTIECPSCGKCDICNCNGCGNCGEAAPAIAVAVVIGGIVALATLPLILAGFMGYLMLQQLREDSNLMGAIKTGVIAIGTAASTYGIYHKVFPELHNAILNHLNSKYPTANHNAFWALFMCHVFMLYISTFPFSVLAGISACVRSPSSQNENRPLLNGEQPTIVTGTPVEQKIISSFDFLRQIYLYSDEKYKKAIDLIEKEYKKIDVANNAPEAPRPYGNAAGMK